MAIVRMKKLTLAVDDSIRDELLNELQATDSVHIDILDYQDAEEAKAKDAWAADLKAVQADTMGLEEIRREIAGALTRIKELYNISAPEFEITSQETLDKLQSKYNFEEMAKKLKALDRETRESEVAIAALEQERDTVAQWAGVVDNFDPIQGKSEFLRGAIGQISEAAFEDFRYSLAEETDLVDVLVAWTADREVFCYVLASIDAWDSVSTVLREKPFNVLNVTRRSGETSQILKDLNAEIEHNVQRYNNALQTWKSYSEKIKELALIHDILEIELQKKKAGGLALSTDSVSFFRGWVPEEALPKVEAILSMYKNIDVSISDPSEDEYDKVPVSLKNNGLTRPFAVLTTMYGTPMYGETVDPTPHLSLFYFVYYGMCMGDALYGAVLLLFSLIMMFRNNANKNAANFYALLAWSGFSAIIAGVLFGSYAGDLFTKYIPVPFLENLSFKFNDGSAFFDKPLFVLFISLLIGAVQLWYGYFIRFVISLKRNGFTALFSELPWLILLAGFFGWAVFVWIAGMAGLNLVSESTAQIFFLLMKIGAILIIVNAIRVGFQKNFVSGIIGPLAGLWDLYGLSSYLSNLLSYARLLALGLSSGIISNVFNQLGFGMIDSLSAINPILSIFGIALLIFLHTFNLVLGGFGAFVHALRLQFVEFFGQFMEGGGKDYNPLARRGSHYTVK